MIAGNPAKIIRSLDEHYNMRKYKYKEEAISQAIRFFQEKGRLPNITEMGSFFPLYLRRSREALITNKIFTKLSGDNEEEVIEAFLHTNPIFENYESFLEVVKSHIH